MDKEKNNKDSKNNFLVIVILLMVGLYLLYKFSGALDKDLSMFIQNYPILAGMIVIILGVKFLLSKNKKTHDNASVTKATVYYGKVLLLCLMIVFGIFVVFSNILK